MLLSGQTLKSRRQKFSEFACWIFYLSVSNCEVSSKVQNKRDEFIFTFPFHDEYVTLFIVHNDMVYLFFSIGSKIFKTIDWLLYGDVQSCCIKPLGL